MPIAPVSLFSIQAILILQTSDGQRILSKYYTPPHLTHTSSTHPTPALPNPTIPTATNPYPTLALQKQFEKGLHSKTAKPNPPAADIILYDNKVVVFKAEGDVTMYVVGNTEENEMMLWHVCLALRDALNILLKNATDRRTLLENYDLISLCLDELIDDGIVLETDPVAIASRVSRAPTHEVGVGGIKNLDLSEQGLLNAWEFGKNQLRERLRQGL
ncbi:Longin-like domain-containing protein [Peziza echinospora]|nr:Longin-like domain-containing protein [Peziza echinospora]